MKNIEWIYPPDVDLNKRALFIKELDISEKIAELLIIREILSIEDAELFLKPRLSSLFPPEKIFGMRGAVEVIKEAIQCRKKIILYGDYDVDGLCSLAILGRYLKNRGLDVDYFVPHRMNEGYGLSMLGITSCLKQTTGEVLIALDCGTNSIIEADLIKKMGYTLIVLDHHEPENTTVADISIPLVNPKLGKYAHYLCAAGVVFKFCHAIEKNLRERSIDLRIFLDLVALATIADVVPLVQENRIFVQVGLKYFEKTHWVGLSVLMKKSNIVAPVTSFDLGFKLGPRINSAGRLGHANTALKLLITDDPLEADHLTNCLEISNQCRKDEEQKVLHNIQTILKNEPHWQSYMGLVLGSHYWHLGVIGIVANRIAQILSKPTLLICWDEHGEGKGSGRSIIGLSLIDLLRECSPFLKRFGGHEMAAGFTLNHHLLHELSYQFNLSVTKRITQEHLISKELLDMKLDFNKIDTEWKEMDRLFAPFGIGNRELVFFSYDVFPAILPQIIKEKHLQLTLEQYGKQQKAIWFNSPNIKKLPATPWKISFTIQNNNWKGREMIQLHIRTILRQ